MYTDMRPAFRHGGEALIVPPVPEKTAPSWLHPVWTGGKNALADSERWIVCGYSLPSYDYAARRLFENAANNGTVRQVVILDPNSEELERIWRDICQSAVVISLPGIPDGSSELLKVLTSG
jgi:hypothetical protein